MNSDIYTQSNSNSQYLFLDDIPKQNFNVCPRDANGALYWESRRVSRESIDQFPHIQLNTHKCVNVIAIDIDSFDSNRICRTLGPLKPNVLVQDKITGYGHALYFLAQPVWLHNATVENYLRDVMERLKRHIPGADPQGVTLNGWTKNPLSSHWRVHQVHDLKFTLSALADHTESLPRACRTIFSGTYEASFERGNRNIDLFEILRRWAYWEWCQSGHKLSPSDWLNLVIENGMVINERFKEALPLAEVRATALSVGRYMAKKKYQRRFSNKWNVGVMGLRNNEMTLSEKCSAAARHTNELRISCNQIKVQVARSNYPSASQYAISRVTKLCRNTVAKYWSLSVPASVIQSQQQVPSIYPDKRNELPLTGSDPSTLISVIRYPEIPIQNPTIYPDKHSIQVTPLTRINNLISKIKTTTPQSNKLTAKVLADPKAKAILEAMRAKEHTDWLKEWQEQQT